jgi:anti-sigma regulatory factor (Ser/Thr protein kinase)
MRLLPADVRRLALSFPAEPAQLPGARRALARWLRALAVETADAEEIVLAFSEACTNAIKHAYGPGGGMIEVEAHPDGEQVEVDVRDFGRWRPKRGDEGGFGLGIMEATTDSVQIDRRVDGTTVRMRRRAGRRVSV